MSDPGEGAAAWMRRAAEEARRGDAGASLAALGKAVEAGPATSEQWRDIGQAYAEHWRFAEAERALARASALDPGDPAVEPLFAHVLQELGDIAGAAAALARASARAPGDLGVALSERLLLPQVYEDQADLDRWRARYRSGLARTLAEIGRFLPQAQRVFALNRTNFLLAYQGEDDCALQRGYSSLIATLLGEAAPALRERPPIRFDGGRRLRVGFVGTIFRDCTAGRYFERWITGLDPARFERFVYQTGALADDFTRRIGASADGFATLRGGARDAADRIRADGLDVLVHPEVGMSALSYVLAAARLAPVQAAGWGHPVTTGSDAIDHYFTCASMEPSDAAGHYTEARVELPGLGVGYAMPAAAPRASRAELGLSGGKRIYACAQSLFKVHPDMDDLVARIAAGDDDAVFVFFQSGARRVTETLAARLQAALARRGVAPRGQLKFLPRMQAAHFRAVLAMADVVLDTPRWSGGNTSLDAFAAGTPVVTLPGRFMRGRQTAGMLALMGLDALVAPAPDDYVRLALDCARDRDRNRGLREAIAERRAALFDRPEPVAAFADALLRIGAGEAIY